MKHIYEGNRRAGAGAEAEKRAFEHLFIFICHQIEHRDGVAETPSRWRFVFSQRIHVIEKGGKGVGPA